MQPKVAKTTEGGKQNLKPTRSCGDFSKVPSSQDIKHKNKGNEDQTQRENIKSSKGKATKNTQRDSHKDNS